MTATPVQPIVMRSSRVTVTLYCGDCLDLLPIEADAVVSDPPYGIDYNPTRSQQSAASGCRKELRKVDGDNEPFDPCVLLQSGKKHVIWGANNFASKLPDAGGWLVWDKREGGALFRGFKMSDCELAWCDVGRMVRTISHRWCGHLRDSERELFVHPTKKPTVVMEWCLQQIGIEPPETVLDPYMGSGTTGVACVRSGLNFIGVEKDERYFDIAVERIRRELAQLRLF